METNTNTAVRPATPLPWYAERGNVDVVTADGEFIATSLQPDSGVATQSEYTDAAYIAAACNAYPKLVEALRSSLELIYSAGDLADCEQYKRAAALLRELGENSE